MGLGVDLELDQVGVDDLLAAVGALVLWLAVFYGFARSWRKLWS